jgi:hypothetical protein
MPHRRLKGRILLACALWFGAIGASQGAGPTVQKTLSVDLAPKIAAASGRQERFAVDVPHAASTDSVGTWERMDGTSIWRYSVRIPDAVSMSFHADHFDLPEGAVLAVGDGSVQQVSYVSASTGSGELWSRITRGDSLFLELHVPTLYESRVRFSIASLQAGYRSLGGGANHPYFDKLRKAEALAGTSCIENFACHETPQNTGNAGATAGIVIGGVALCTATLVNNLRNDGTPYLLTARHCQDGPASSVTVYWDATTPCGQTLGTVYDTQTPTFTNYAPHTVFEQQDVWMLDLGAPVNSSQAYFAGWNATGGTFIGGYSPHHALGRSLQYVEWFGQAVPVTLPGSVLGKGYESDFWGVVNSVGSVGSGASGGGLFDPDQHLVGVASMAYLQNGPGSDGLCPANPPAAPNADNAAALYSSLAAVWESNADTTSFTNPVTLKSLLDPDNTGRKVSDGFEQLTNMTLSATGEVAETGWPATLTWNAPGATTCTATGGTAGDGWAGVKSVGGSLNVLQYGQSVANYTLRCSNGARYAERSLQIAWVNHAPFLDLRYVTPVSSVVGAVIRLQWRSNVQPCVASGGGAGDGWAGAKNAVTLGEQDVPFTQAGTITWTMTCGSGTRTISKDYVQQINAVAVDLVASATTLRVNQPMVMLMPSAFGTSCTRTGGVAGDNWAGPYNQGMLTTSYTSPTARAVTYTMTCAGGGHTASDSVTVTYTNDAPAATIVASAANPHVPPPEPPASYPNGHHPDAIQINWTSNMAPCDVTYDGPGAEDGVLVLASLSDSLPIDSRWDLRVVPGDYTYTVSCGTGGTKATASTVVHWQPNAPVVKFHVLDTNVTANEQFFLAWNGNVGSCTRSGGAAGDGWAGGPGTASGSVPVTLAGVGSHTYHIACASGGDVATDDITLTVPPNAVTFRPHAAQARVDQLVSIGWDATIAPCNFSGLVPTVNSPAHTGVAITGGPAGTQIYTVRCGAAEATTQVEWLPAPKVDIIASVAEASVGKSVMLTWTSSNAQHCEVSRGGYVDWAGDLPTSGSRTLARSVPASGLFGIMCDGAEDFVGVNWLPISRGVDPFPSPTVSLTIDATSKNAGDTVTLNWTTTHAAGCTGEHGALGDQWEGNLPVSGSRSVIVNVAGTYTWDIVCQGGLPPARASVTATFAAATPPPPPPPPPPPSGGGATSSGGGGGGGGSFDPLLLIGLVSSMAWSRTRRQPRSISLPGQPAQ